MFPFFNLNPATLHAAQVRCLGERGGEKEIYRSNGRDDSGIRGPKSRAGERGEREREREREKGERDRGRERQVETERERNRRGIEI